jgi:hypothetical protein
VIIATIAALELRVCCFLPFIVVQACLARVDGMWDMGSKKQGVPITERHENQVCQCPYSWNELVTETIPQKALCRSQFRFCGRLDKENCLRRVGLRAADRGRGGKSQGSKGGVYLSGAVVCRAWPRAAALAARYG